ncbi:MAG: thioredoxin family protein [Desulfobacteraceae bacterium]|nr:thioredoxin family protein [Desulfobacteraceae bacterium]
MQMDVTAKKESAKIKGDSAIDWKDYKQGIVLSESEGKHIFLYFHADWCTYCKKLKQTTFKDKKVLSYLKENFISISVDTDINKEVANQWKVKGLPTLWFLKPDNSKISHLPGYVDAKQFLSILKYIQSKSYDKKTFQEYMETI